MMSLIKNKLFSAILKGHGDLPLFQMGPKPFFFCVCRPQNRAPRSLTPTQLRPGGPWRGGGSRVMPYVYMAYTVSWPPSPLMPPPPPPRGPEPGASRSAPTPRCFATPCTLF